MEPNQSDVSREGEAASGQKAEGASRGLASRFWRAMGKTVKLAQRAGKRSAHDVIAVGRKAGRILKAGRTQAVGQEKKLDELQARIDQLRAEIRPVYSRIGKRVCQLAANDPRFSSGDPQLEAYLSVVTDKERQIQALKEQASALEKAPDEQPAEAATARDSAAEAPGVVSVSEALDAGSESSPVVPSSGEDDPSGEFEEVGEPASGDAREALEPSAPEDDRQRNRPRRRRS